MSSRLLVDAAVMTAAALTAVGVVAYVINRRKPASRVDRYISISSQLFRLQRLEGALEAARVALDLAAAELTDSPEHCAALHHLSAICTVAKRPSEALELIDELIARLGRLHGEESDRLIPALFAKAEILEATEQPLALAAEQVARVREIRRKVSGANTMEAAFASANLSSILMRGAGESGLPAARRDGLLRQSVALCLEACSVSTVSGNSAQAAMFAADALKLLGDDQSKAGQEVLTKLRGAYAEAAGREWHPGNA